MEDSTVHARMRAVLASIQQEFDFSTFTWAGAQAPTAKTPQAHARTLIFIIIRRSS